MARDSENELSNFDGVKEEMALGWSKRGRTGISFSITYRPANQHQWQVFGFPSTRCQQNCMGGTGCGTPGGTDPERNA